MKRKLTLAIGCLAAAMPNLSNASTPARTANVAQAERRVNIIGATQAALSELEHRGLAADHSIASVVFLKGAGLYDVRIEPPAQMTDGLRLRGFSVSIDGRVEPVTGFRATV